MIGTVAMRGKQASPSGGLRGGLAGSLGPHILAP